MTNEHKVEDLMLFPLCENISVYGEWGGEAESSDITYLQISMNITV